MKLNSQKVKQKALKLGFSKVGISKANPTPEEKEKLFIWLANNKNGSMEWMSKRKEERGNIFKYFKEAKSIISVAMNYYTGSGQKGIKSDYKFSNYAWGDDYHSVLKDKLFNLLNWIKAIDMDIKAVVCVDTSPVMEKVWAQKSGLGWIGKHTNLITKEYGSWVFLGEIILDIELEYDLFFDDDLCGTCTACIDSCPTQALTEYLLDSRKCISYLNIEKRGDFSEQDKELDGWIYGCDVCQEVCPWNIKFSQVSEQKSFEARDKIKNFSNIEWEELNRSEFKDIFKESAVKRTKYEGLKRNIERNKKSS